MLGQRLVFVGRMRSLFAVCTVGIVCFKGFAQCLTHKSQIIDPGNSVPNGFVRKGLVFRQRLYNGCYRSDLIQMEREFRLRRGIDVHCLFGPHDPVRQAGA